MHAHVKHSSTPNQTCRSQKPRTFLVPNRLRTNRRVVRRAIAPLIGQQVPSSSPGTVPAPQRALGRGTLQRVHRWRLQRPLHAHSRSLPTLRQGTRRGLLWGRQRDDQPEPGVFSLLSHAQEEIDRRVVDGQPLYLGPERAEGTLALVAAGLTLGARGDAGAGGDCAGQHVVDAEGGDVEEELDGASVGAEERVGV